MIGYLEGAKAFEMSRYPWVARSPLYDLRKNTNFRQETKS
jgi:hypothetical protein